MNRKCGNRHWPSAVVLAVPTAAAGIIGISSTALTSLDQQLGLPWLFAVRGPALPPENVAIVSIDERTLSTVCAGGKSNRCPRSLHGDLVKFLASQDARVIAFDLTFATPSDRMEEDIDFAQAASGFGNVLIAEAVRMGHEREDHGQDLPVDDSHREGAIPLLAHAVAGSAPFLLPKDARVDSYWTHYRGEPTLPLLAFQLFRGQTSPPALASGRGRGSTDAVPPMASSKVSGSGSETEPDDIHEEQYLNFYGPSRTIQTTSYADVIQAARSIGRLSASDRFAGKAVFVGYSAATRDGQDRIRDDYHTVFSDPDGLNLSGVEIAATAFANLLEDRNLRATSLSSNFAIVGLWATLLTLMCRRSQTRTAITLALCASAVFLMCAWVLFEHKAIWVPLLVPIGMQLPIAVFCGVWISKQDARRDRQAIKEAFAYFVPDSFVEQVIESTGPPSLANRVFSGVCLATDLEKYTTLAEGMEPGRLGKFLNEYYAQLFVPVERWDGIIIDIVGDAMVAIWAKTADADVRRNACSAVIDILERLNAYNAESRRHGRQMLETRFGIGAGDMLIGSVGASGHYEYRAMGDIVNTASRIQALNKVLGTHVLASAASLEGMDEFAVRPLGSFLLVGKASPVAIAELVGRAESIGSSRAAFLKRFADALGQYQAGRWNEAELEFSRLRAEDGADGPTRFYHDRCASLIRDGSRLPPNAPIEIHVK